MAKIARCLIVAFLFLCVLIVFGYDVRVGHELLFSFGCMIIFAFLLDNIWLTLFMLWTVLLFGFFKFNFQINFGDTYLSNIFFGCTLYYVVKRVFRKEHIDFFIKGLLWLTVLNIVYLTIQHLGYDFIYTEGSRSGFMGNRGVLGILMVFCVPLIASRPHKWAIPISLCLFVPIWLSKSTVCIGAGLIGLLFVLFFKMPRKFWIGLVIVSLLAVPAYIKYKDTSESIMQRVNVWKLILSDAKNHPIVGWGLDSFKQTSEKKQQVYVLEANLIEEEDGKHLYIQWWDNPHSLYVSLIFEFGLVGLFLFCGYIRQLCIDFRRSIKEPNLVALAGFALVFLIISVAQFPIFLARMCVIIIPAFALLECQLRT